MWIRTALLVALVACGSSTPPSEKRYVTALSSCGCPADAAVDAPRDGSPDAAPPPDAFVDPYAAAWPRHVIYPGSMTGAYKGADGVDLATIGGQLAVAAPWEQGGAVTVSLKNVDGAWQTVTCAIGMFGAEDAKWIDADGDGRLDVAIARDADARIHISFQPAAITDPWTTVLLTASQTPYHGRWLQLAAADIDGDGLVDIIGGSRIGTNTNPAVFAWFKNPGPANARTGSAWTFHQIDIAGWAMSVIVRDVDLDGHPDLVVSDRAYYLDTASVRHYERMGSRWLQNIGGGASWVNHTIAQPSTGTSQAAYGMIWVGDWDGDGVDDVIEGQGTTGSPNRIAIHRNEGTWFGTWGTEAVPDVANVGNFQAVNVADIDGDGRKDLVVSTTENGGVGPNYPASGVYWLRNAGPLSWDRMELSGPLGTKWDNTALFDMDGDGHLDVLVDEQSDQQGLEWFENPGR